MFYSFDFKSHLGFDFSLQAAQNIVWIEFAELEQDFFQIRNIYHFLQCGSGNISYFFLYSGYSVITFFEMTHGHMNIHAEGNSFFSSIFTPFFFKVFRYSETQSIIVGIMLFSVRHILGFYDPLIRVIFTWRNWGFLIFKGGEY